MRFRAVIKLMVIMILVIPAQISAQGCGARNVEEEATVPIFCNDIEAAREAALVDAKRKAIASLGVTIESEALYLKGIQRENWYDLKWKGCVQNYEVLEQRRVGDSYKIKIRALIADDKNSKSVPKRMLNEMTILIRSEGAGSPVIKDLLVDELTAVGCRNPVVDDPVFLQGPGLYGKSHHQADVLITVRSSLEHLQWSETLSGSWFHGEARIDIARTQAGLNTPHLIDASFTSNKIICKADSPNIKMIGDCLSSRHPNGFARQVAEPVVDAFMMKLTENEEITLGDRVVMIKARNVPSRAAVNKFLSILKQLRGVGGRVELTECEDSDYTIKTIFPMKARYLVYLLESLGSYRVLSYNWKNIELEFL